MAKPYSKDLREHDARHDDEQRNDVEHKSRLTACSAGLGARDRCIGEVLSLARAQPRGPL